jgi:hypothetical protein
MGRLYGTNNGKKKETSVQEEKKMTKDRDTSEDDSKHPTLKGHKERGKEEEMNVSNI